MVKIKDKINEVLGNRVKENCAYENVYTLALRGLHDAAMGGGDVPMKEKVKMLESALKDQRNLIAEHIDRPVETIPQAFTHTRRCWKSIRMDWNCRMM